MADFDVWFHPDAPADGDHPNDRVRYLVVGTDIDVDSDNSGGAPENTNGFNSGEDFYENHPASELTSHPEFKNGVLVVANDDSDDGDVDADNGWNGTDWSGPESQVVVAGENDLKPLVLRAIKLGTDDNDVRRKGMNALNPRIIIKQVSGTGKLRIFTTGASPQVVWNDTSGGFQYKLPDNTTFWDALKGNSDINLQIEGLKAGEVILEVCLQLQGDAGPEIHRDRVRITVLGLDLQATGLVSTDASGGYVVMRKDGVGSYTNDTFSSGGDREIDNDKVWEDTNFDDTSETEDPVCYTIGKTAKLKTSVIKTTSLAGGIAIKLKVDATPTGHSGTVENVVFGPVDATISASTTSLTVTALSGDHTVGTVVNNFTYNLEWKYSLDGGTTWQRFQKNTQKIFVLLGEPLTGYCSNTGPIENPLSVETALAKTARRIDWACKVCKGKDATNIEGAAADYINDTNGFSLDGGFTNPFTHLDSGETAAGDCISIANLAATALRLNHVDARPAKARCNYKVVADNNQTWGWTRKMHKYHDTTWHLAWSNNNFEGFFHIGPFVKWTTYPSKGYIVGPERHDIVAPAGKEKYLPTLVLRAFFDGAGTLRWVGGGDQPDIEWKPTHSIPGLSLEAYGVSWHSDDANDGEYDVAWDKDAKTLKLHTGTAVAITGAGAKTLTCTIGTESCSIDVNVTDWAALQAAATQTKTIRIVPARTQADAP